MTFVMLAITYIGSQTVILGLVVLSTVLFFAFNYHSRIAPLLVAILGSVTTTYIIKYLVLRSRPLAQFYIESSPSFPSGHATAAMALYGFFFYIVLKHNRSNLKKLSLTFFVLIIFLVGASRLYLGVHYFWDILVGYIIGLIWIYISAKIHKRLLRFKLFRNRLEDSFQ